MAKRAPEQTPAAPKQVEGELLDAEFPGEFPTNGQADSKNGQSGQIGAGSESSTTRTVEGETENDAGDVAIVGAGSVPGAELLPNSSRARLPGEKKHDYWERMRKAARLAVLPRGQGVGTAYFWATEQTDREFPPAAPAIVDPDPDDSPEPASIPVAPAPVSDDQGVSGLSELPPGWPELPANAQLQVEIAWVTANRLRVRDGTGVNLSKALSPAPSYSALSWLETSILFPAKFADISVKATASQDDEREFIRREKLAIEEIRGILAEMLEAKD